MGGDPCRKCRPSAVMVAEMVRHDRGDQQPVHGKGTQHLRQCGHPRACSVREDDGIDPPNAKGGEPRHDAP